MSISARRVKRLLFGYTPDPEESFVGAFAAALHEHRLRSMRAGIEGAGLSLARPGSLQMASDDQIAAIAAMLRTDPALLRGAAFLGACARDRLVLGGVELPRSFFDFEHRWIGPHQLQNETFHRTDWLNRLLPYCPLSLERLVGTCPNCGPLGWRTTRGIANCDECGKAIPRSVLPDIDQAFAEPYRLAAGLMSRNDVIGAAAVSRLPKEVQGYARSTLCDIMIRTGIVFSNLRTDQALINITKHPPEEIARIVSMGARFIIGWPLSVMAEVKNRTDAIGDDLAGYDRIRVDLRWLSRGSKEGSQLVEMAFPTLDGRTAKPFAPKRSYYTATETNTKLWTNSSELAPLREAGAIRYEKLPSNLRLRARYDANDVDALHSALNDAISPGTAASLLDIPKYALEQFVGRSLLAARDEPGVRLLRGMQISMTSIEALKERLRTASIVSVPGEDWVPLKRMMIGIPGEKPWGATIDLLLGNSVIFHFPVGQESIRDLLIDPTDFDQLRQLDPECEPDTAGAVRVPLRDAYEILGVPEAEAMVSIRSAQLTIIKEGRGKAVCRHELRRLVAKIAFTGEVAIHEATSPVATYHQLVRLKIPRIHGGWSRLALVERGMVNTLMPSDFRKPIL